MKKLIWIAMAFVLTIGLLSGCGGKSVQPEPTPSPTPAATAEPTPTPAPTPIPFEAVLNGQVAGYKVPADSSEVYAALSAVWAAEAEEIVYGGDSVEAVKPEDGAVTLYGAAAAEHPSAGTPVSSGEYLYALSGTALNIFRADGANTALLATLEVGSGWSDTQEGQETTWGGFEKYPTHLYLWENRLAVLSNWYGYESYMENAVNVCDYTEYTCVDMYDLTDPVAPVLTASFGQDGSCRAAEVKDGVLYLISDHPVYSDAAASEESAYIPQLYSAEGANSLEAAQIILPDAPADSVYAVVGAYDLASAGRTDVKAILGINGETVISASSIYLTAERYATVGSAPYRDNIYDVSEFVCSAVSDVYRLELSGGEFAVKNASVVSGHSVGERAASVDADGLNLALRQESFRYTLYTDSQRGFENVLWGELENGESVICLSSQLQPAAESKADVFAGYLYGWTDGGFVGLYRDDTGVLKLALLNRSDDGSLLETDFKTFGSDYSKTLSSSEAIYVNSEKNIIGFAADDGYSFYRYDVEAGFVSLFDAYLTDWPWHVRCAAEGDFLYMIDRNTVYIYSLTDLTLVHSLTL